MLPVGVTTANLVRLAPNTAYVYDYVATSRLGDIAVFVTNAKAICQFFDLTIADSIHVVLPWGAEQIWQGLQTIFQEIRNLIRSPQTAAGNIAKAVYRIYYAVRGLISMKDQIDDVCFFKEGKQPYWFHLKTQIEEILDDIQRVWQLFKVEAPAWVDGFVDHSTDVLGQAFSHETLSELRRKVIDEFKAALEDLPNQIGPTADIIQPFLDAYTSTVGTVKKVKSCYDSLKQGHGLPDGPLGLLSLEVLLSAGHWTCERVCRRVNRLCQAFLPNSRQIHKGEKVGTAAATGCEKNSIHFAIKALGSDEYVDPTRYLRKPVMTSGDNKPGWRQHCDMYWLMFMGETIASGNLTDILKDEDETPEEPDVDLDDSARSSTAITSLSSETYTKRSLKREIAVALTNNPDFAQTIGVHNVTDITNTFSIRLQDLKLSKVLDILQLLDEPDMGAIRDRLLSTTEQVQQYLDADPFKLPGTLTDDQLRRELQRRGKSAEGSRQQLLQRYTTTTDNGCPNIFHHLNKLTNIYCDIQNDCLGFKCSLSFPTSPHTEVTTKAGVRFDPCTMKLTMELGRHREEKNLTSAGFAEEDEYYNDKSWTLFDGVLLVRSFRVQRTGLSFTTELHYISRSELRRVLPEANLTDMNQLVRDLTRVLRMSYKEVLVASIDLAVQEAVQELESSDSYLNGSFPLGPWDKTFFEVRVPFNLGPITMYLKFAAGGYIAVKVEAGVSIMKMKGYGKATPDVSAVVEASVGVSLLLISGELQLKGYILKTAFPSAAEITFDKFPLNVGVRMDMVMVPLRLELHGIVKIFSQKIIDIMIWHYETSPVIKNIFNTGLPEPDLTPPKFRKFKLQSRKANSRRSEVTSHCDVQQLPGRDVVEPAFQLAVAAEDDVSQVKLTYDVGTYRGGSDVVKGEDLGGPSNIIVRSMKGGVPLYFTVTAENSGGGDARVTCELPTYDVTLPGGRVTPDFLTTSHPNILRASAVAFDDSKIIQKLAAVGYGRKVYGDQVVTWHDVNTTTNTITTGHPPTALERFTGYANTLTSPGVLTDFTPPSPGPLENVIMDVLMTEDCGDFVLDHWERARCVEQTPLQNHRWIVDGEGSRTVFNGHEPLVDMRYTRANRYVSANWDGFHDNETGIHGYSWTVGTTPCQEDVHPHIDPHAHLFDVSEWTHEGIASPLFLEDGKYHVTVRAINSVEFGGAMATTVCHTTPYVIDNTPPFVHHVHSVRYDDDVISAEYNVSDPLSDIQEIDFGLGRSKRDVHMMDWYRHGNTTHTSVNFHIPDGVPAWVKVRAINNVDLREVGHAEYPLLVDTTPPVAGTLYDGSVHGHDLNFTSDPNTICANWKDFHDEHSGLILFDATPPVEGTLRDGLEPDSDLAFSSEPSTVSANWAGYSDLESGIGDYAVTVQRTSSIDGNGTPSPEIIHDKTSVGPDTTQINWHKFHLRHGDHVSVQLEATNQAMGSTMTSSNGFVLDLTRPVMVHLGDGAGPGEDRTYSMINVRIGVTSGEPEELEDGYALHTDLQGIQASWMATDFESGVVSYWVSVGTTPGDSDVSDYQSLGSGRDGYIGNLNLQVTNKTTNSPIYYLTVKAKNAAGIFSRNITSSPIKVVRADQAGTVTDGWEAWSTVEHAMAVDIDYQRDVSTVTVRFSGFESDQHGIIHYEWSVGTEPRLDDVQPYTASGIVLSDHTDNPGGGLSSHGLAQSLLPLSPGVQYYATVRAITGAGNVLDFSTDGFTVDITPPVIQIDSVGVQIGNNSFELDWERSHYQKSADSVNANWHIIESEDAIASSWFCYGSYPGACDIYPVTNTTDTSVPNSLVKPKSDGMPNILTVSSMNVAISGSLTVDETPPVAGEVFCPQFVQDSSELSCHWHRFYDTESTIQYYMFGVGEAEGGDSIFNFTRIPSHQTHFSPGGVTMTHDATYYVTVVGYNAVEDSQAAFSAPIVVDNTPPIAGVVVELSGTENVNVTTRHGAKTCISEQGQTYGNNNELKMHDGQTFFVAVRATNEMDFTYTVRSDGITVMLEPLIPGEVRDGDIVGYDLNFQPSVTSLSANWDRFGKLEEDKEQTIEYYEVALGTDRRFPRTRNNVHPYVNVGLNQTHTFNNLQQICEVEETEEYASLMGRFDVHPLTNVGKDTAVETKDLELLHNKTYVVVVIVTDQSAECSLASSLVTVDVTPPSGGSVWPGLYKDTAVSYSSRTDELHVSWADFSDPESGIDHYEIAVISGAACSEDADERFQETEFVLVPSNYTEYTVTDISLQSGIPYFVRLRTFNKAGLSIITESPPILLDLEDPIGGTVKDGRDFSSDVTHQSSTTTVEGTFIYLPNHDGERCPSRQYLMEAEEVGWDSVSSNSILGLKTDHRILFSEDQITFGDDGLSITMSRDVQQTRMYSGAYSTRADMQGGGSYRFDMIAASGDIKAVTSVVFWDGPAGVVGDLEAPVEQWAREEAATEPPDCTCCLKNIAGDSTTTGDFFLELVPTTPSTTDTQQET
uniref:SAP domain-containing protein n=1 Tax=Branchiostoma floridae TaxID=7739 RepID=C3ZSG1_BRAFL|eukprot:XP_002588515.1 hypothetical protein BRAFLDRAFT_79470 [Branchiostoma floridae]